MSRTPDSPNNRRTSLLILAGLFFRLGATAFGGPAAHIAMMQNEVVTRRQWLTNQEFLDLISACNLIPGPNSTEMAIHIGYRQAGYPGLLVAGFCFILPAATMVLAIAWAYLRYAHLPSVTHILNGIKPIIIAIILQALIGLAKGALKTKFLIALFALVVVCCFFSNNELALLPVGAGLSLLWSSRDKDNSKQRTKIACAVGALALAAVLAFAQGSHNTPVELAKTEPFSPTKLFLYFLKIGSVLYGSGYVLLAFLRSDLVEKWHWLTTSQLLDATAVGQVTPGPVFTTATFIGYILGGTSSAILATVGIFLPAFLIVALTAPFIERLRQSQIASAALDGVNCASMALMAYVTFELGKQSLTDPLFICEAALAALMLWKYNINPTWLIFVGAIIGMVHHG